MPSMRAVTHIGLAVAVILAPVLCCCHVGAVAARTPARSPARNDSAGLIHSCCRTPTVAQASCCGPQPSIRFETPGPSPARPAAARVAPAGGSCGCYAERLPAVPAETRPVVLDPPPAERLPLADFCPAVLAEQVRLCPGGPDPPGRPAWDAVREALDHRHVLRC